MPWQGEPKKDVLGCDKPRGEVKNSLIRGFQNGETYLVEDEMIGNQLLAVNLETGFIK